MLLRSLLPLASIVAAFAASCQVDPEQSLNDSTGGIGYWGPVLELPTHPEQMAVLPTGKVLMWPWAPERKDPPHGPVALWDPADGSSTVYTGSGVESASGLAFQSDGTLLIAGGDMPEGGVDGSSRSFIFDYTTELLSEVASMHSRRVYPGLSTLGTGDILVTGGWEEQGHVNGTAELWSGNAWTLLPFVFGDEFGLWTFQFLAPDGRLFRAGPERLSGWLDVTAGTWSDLESGNRSQTRHHGIAVMYDEGKILLAGGCPVGPQSGWNEQCRGSVLATAEVIDLQSPTPAWRRVSPMARPRHSHHATLLPDGRVLITGGTDQPGLFHDETAGILITEIWDPATETFTTVAAMDEPHHFQSAAVLLPDATVLVAGGRFGPAGGEPHFSWSGQVYSPDYLSRGARPAINRAPSGATYGAVFTVETDEPESIADVVLLGLSTSRVGWNSGQRLAHLNFTVEEEGIRAAAPSNPNLAPPGFYLLFLMSEQQVPSLGATLLVRHDDQ